MSEFMFSTPADDPDAPEAMRRYFSDQWSLDPSPRWWAEDQKAMFGNPRDQPKWSIKKHPSDSYIWCGHSFDTFDEARQFVVDEIEKWAKGPYGPSNQIKRLDKPYAVAIGLQAGDRVAVELQDGSIWHGLMQISDEFKSELLQGLAEWQKRFLGQLAGETPDTRPPVPKPSTTPPMWANDISRSRRPKRQKGQQRTRGTR